MLFNKNQYRKINNKKVLHKVKKQWVTVSLALLLAIGGGTAVSTHTSANAKSNNKDNDNDNIDQGKLQHGQDQQIDHNLAQSQNKINRNNVVNKQDNDLHTRMMKNANLANFKSNQIRLGADNGVDANTSAEVQALETKPGVVSAVSNAQPGSASASGSAKAAKSGSSSASVSYLEGTVGSAASYYAKALNESNTASQAGQTVQSYVNSLNAKFPSETSAFSSVYNSYNAKYNAESSTASAYQSIASQSDYSSELSTLAKKANMTSSAYVDSMEANYNSLSAKASDAPEIISGIQKATSWASLMAKNNTDPSFYAENSSKADSYGSALGFADSITGDYMSLLSSVYNDSASVAIYLNDRQASYAIASDNDILAHANSVADQDFVNSINSADAVSGTSSVNAGSIFSNVVSGIANDVSNGNSTVLANLGTITDSNQLSAKPNSDFAIYTNDQGSITSIASGTAKAANANGNAYVFNVTSNNASALNSVVNDTVAQDNLTAMKPYQSAGSKASEASAFGSLASNVNSDLSSAVQSEIPIYKSYNKYRMLVPKDYLKDTITDAYDPKDPVNYSDAWNDFINIMKNKLGNDCPINLLNVVIGDGSTSQLMVNRPLNHMNYNLLSSINNHSNNTLYIPSVGPAANSISIGGEPGFGPMNASITAVISYVGERHDHDGRINNQIIHEYSFPTIGQGTTTKTNGRYYGDDPSNIYFLVSTISDNNGSNAITIADEFDPGSTKGGPANFKHGNTRRVYYKGDDYNSLIQKYNYYNWKLDTNHDNTNNPQSTRLLPILQALHNVNSLNTNNIKSIFVNNKLKIEVPWMLSGINMALSFPTKRNVLPYMYRYNKMTGIDMSQLRFGFPVDPSKYSQLSAAQKYYYIDLTKQNALENQYNLYNLENLDFSDFLYSPIGSPELTSEVAAALGTPAVSNADTNSDGDNGSGTASAASDIASVAPSAIASEENNMSAFSSYSNANDTKVALAPSLATDFATSASADSTSASAVSSAADNFYKANADAKFTSADQTYQTNKADHADDAALANAYGTHAFNYGPKYVTAVTPVRLHTDTAYGTKNDKVLASVLKGTQLQVLGIGIDPWGHARYKVAVVTGKSAASIGYVSGNTKFVQPTYLLNQPKATVQLKRNVREYSDAGFTKPVKMLKAGQFLTAQVVSEDKTYGGFTRLQLADGNYITANTKYVDLTDGKHFSDAVNQVADPNDPNASQQEGPSITFADK